jgi:hypothetical protein
MTLQAFADDHQLRTVTDPGDHTTIVRGQLGHIFEYGDGLLGILIMPGDGHPKWWFSAKKSCLTAGMKLHLNGDREGSLLFDPSNFQEARLALRWAGIKSRRLLSPKQQAVLATHQFQRHSLRENTPLKGARKRRGAQDGVQGHVVAQRQLLQSSSSSIA